MKAARIGEYGGPEVIKVVANADRPATSDGQLLIEVWAASLNPVDTYLRSGGMHDMAPLKFPATLGGDFAGVVAQVGRGVTGFEVDDEVYGQANALLGGTGSLAELTAASANMTALKPKSVDFRTAAALPLVGGSAVQAIIDHLAVKSGQHILIHGAAGGVGSIAVQIAKHLGAYVVATALPEDIPYVRELGADEIIDTRKQPFESVIRDIDGVLDTIGGDFATKSYDVIRRGGTLVSMTAEPDEDRMKERGITAISQFTQPTTERLTRLAQLVDEGVVTPRVSRTFSIDQIAEAFRYREESKPAGKVVIDVHATSA